MSIGKNGAPSLEECKAVFSRIVDLLDGEFDPETEPGNEGTHDEILKAVSDLAAGFFRDITDNEAEAAKPEATAEDLLADVVAKQQAFWDSITTLESAMDMEFYGVDDYSVWSIETLREMGGL